jgi:hypothetical protein
MESFFEAKIRGRDAETEDWLGLDPLRDGCLGHFLAVWLRSMGYGTESNRLYLMGRVKLKLGVASLRAFQEFYVSLGRGSICCQKRKELLVETCRNGWEYFLSELSSQRYLERRASKSSNFWPRNN